MSATPIEVELKFPVDSLAPVRDQLAALGGTAIEVTRQADEYLNDPLRNFAELDIALRFRRIGDREYLTWKGPNLDSSAKIREEIETELPPEATAAIRRTFLGIGLFSVAVVTKQRETWKLDWHGDQIEVCLDDVDEIGCFIEIERVVDGPEGVEPAKQSLQGLAEQLGLSNPTRTSYLEMLLASRGQL